MHLKKVIMMGTAAALFASSLLNVSAAELSAGNYAEALKENEKKDLIINVEAYKAAYSDLAEAFGDDENAYIEHYLTIGVYEGRTKGVLFDPLAYAEAYEDVKAAFGYDISAIVNHYITFGVTENRTLGTANGYEDIATAEKNGGPKIIVQRDNVRESNYSTNAAISSYETNAVGTGNVNTATDSSNYGHSTVGIANSSMVAGNSSVNTEHSNNSVAPSNTNINYTSTTANSSSGNNSAPASSTNISDTSTTVNSSSDNNSAPASGTNDNNKNDNNKNYQHTTSIYDESTLLRVEYYDDNNKLVEYSDVTNYDKDTNSYTETVYRYDDEKQVEIATRTDTYVNGELVSSEKH